MVTQKNSKEITALLQLLDDPDALVSMIVEERLMAYGTAVIPRLERFWERTQDRDVQARIEHLIHKALFQDLKEDFAAWALTPVPEIMQAAILIGRYRYPNLVKEAIHTQFNQMNRNVWLEINAYLTPLEKINVINGILYNYYKLRGQSLGDFNPEPFYINNVVGSMQGNAFSIGLIYLALCEVHDIPVFAVDVPGVFLLAYIDNLYSFRESEQPVKKIQFFIDPVNGAVFTHNDVNNYLIGNNFREYLQRISPISTKMVIIKMLQALSNTYQMKKDADAAAEIDELVHLLLTVHRDL